MPTDDGVRFDDRQRRSNIGEQPREADENQSIGSPEGRPLGPHSPQNIDLLAQHQVLNFKRRSGAEQPDQRPPDQSANIPHRPQHQPIRARSPLGEVCGRDSSEKRQAIACFLSRRPEALCPCHLYEVSAPRSASNQTSSRRGPNSAHQTLRADRFFASRTTAAFARPAPRHEIHDLKAKPDQQETLARPCPGWNTLAPLFAMLRNSTAAGLEAISRQCAWVARSSPRRAQNGQCLECPVLYRSGAPEEIRTPDLCLRRGRGAAEGLWIGFDACRRSHTIRRLDGKRFRRGTIDEGWCGATSVIRSIWSREVRLMMNLSEYRRRSQTLADFLPWAALVERGVILNKDGSFQRTARFRGPDLDSATAAELVGTTARLNNALRRLGSGWAIFVEASRIAAQRYPQSRFPDRVSNLVDAERRAQFEEAGAHFESAYYLTFLWLPPSEEASRAERWLYEGRPRQDGVNAHELLNGFIDRTDRVLQLVEGFVPESAWLSDSETLTYLHSTISTRRHRVRVPEIPVHLDALLADEPLTCGLEPGLGNAHLRILTIIGFPTVTFPGILDELNRLAFPYRWSTRAICLDKTEATRLLVKIRRQWFAKRKSIMAILKEVMTNESSALLDSDAHNKALDADAALQELGSDAVSSAYVTATVAVWDDEAPTADEKLRLVEKVIHGRDFTCIPETVNAVEAWLGSLPGHVYANVRQPPVSTLNLAR